MQTNNTPTTAEQIIETLARLTGHLPNKPAWQYLSDIATQAYKARKQYAPPKQKPISQTKGGKTNG